MTLLVLDAICLAIGRLVFWVGGILGALWIICELAMQVIRVLRLNRVLFEFINQKRRDHFDRRRGHE